MAKLLATQELVFGAAQALVAEGHEPSIVLVQARIGGGSYTTIKRHLDAWSAQQAIHAQTLVEAPGTVLEKSAEFGRTLWAMAVREASKDALAVKEIADGKLAALGKELEFAQSEIGRMEEAEVAHNVLMERTQIRLETAESALGEARIQVSKVPDLEARLVSMQSELDTVRRVATESAVEAGRVSGEAEALRAQAHDLTAALVALKSKPAA